MSDLLVLLVILLLPAGFVVGLLSLLTMGLAAVADLDGNGLVRPATRDRRLQPAPGSLSRDVPADGSLTIGPASRISSVTPSA